jgi:hypothetical protein
MQTCCLLFVSSSLCSAKKFLALSSEDTSNTKLDFYENRGLTPMIFIAGGVAAIHNGFVHFTKLKALNL